MDITRQPYTKPDTERQILYDLRLCNSQVDSNEAQNGRDVTKDLGEGRAGIEEGCLVGTKIVSPG